MHVVLGHDEHLPAVAVRVGDPDLVLDGVAAGRALLDEGWETGGLEARLGLLHGLGRANLHAEVTHGPAGGLRGEHLVEGQVHGGLRWLELDVARTHLGRGDAEQDLVEGLGGPEVLRGESDMDPARITVLSCVCWLLYC